MWRYIRKFGLEHCDLPTMFWNVSFFMRALTLNISSKDKRGIPIYMYVIMIATFLTYFYVYFASMLWFVFVRSTETGDLVGAMVVLSLGLSTEIGVLKPLYMLFYIDKIQKLTDDYLEFDSHMIPGSRLSVNLMKCLRDVKKRAILYWLVIMGNGVVYILKPTMSPGRHLLEDFFVIYGLEPMFESPNYEIATVMMIVCVGLICHSSSTVTGYLIVIIGYAESQMLALSEEVTNIWPDAKEYYKDVTKFEHDNVSIDYERKNRIMNEHVCKSLRDIIKRHATVKRLLDQVEDLFRKAIAMGFSLLVIALIAELLGGLDNTYLQIPFAFIQVGIECFIGQRLMDASIIFEQAVYNCKWENFDKNNMKMVLLMLQCSQKTMAISAGGVSKMDFGCLMAAMRATYSAYAAIRSIMK